MFSANERTLSNQILSWSIFLALTAALAGCAQGFDRNGAVLGFAETHPDATTEQAECVVDRLLDRYALEDLEAKLASDPMEPGFEEAQFRDMFACGLEGDVRDQIATELESTGLKAEEAPCVADALVEDLDDADIDVLLSGEITDAFYEKFFVAMESCGAVNE